MVPLGCRRLPERLIMGGGNTALGPPRLPGEQAVSRVADALAGDDVAGRCQRPRDAAPVPAHC